MRLFDLIKNIKLGAKLNGLAFLVFSFLLLGTVLATINSLNSFIRQAGRQNVIQDAQTIQIRFGEIEQETLNNTVALSNIPGLAEALVIGDTQSIQAEILIAAARLDFDDVDVVRANGVRLFDVREAGAEDEDRLIALALLGFDATGVLVISEDEQVYISIGTAVPIHDTSGATIGAVLGSRIIDNEMLSRVNVKSGQSLDLGLIVDGRILASDFESPEDLEYFSARLLDSNSVGQALNGQTVLADQLISNPTGSPHALGYTPLTIGADTRAVISLTVNMGELADFQNQLVINQLVIFVLITLISLGVFALFASNGIVAPIRRLQLAAEQLAIGNYAQRVSSAAKDEVGQLANSFDSMATQLHDLIGSLEQRVADRTKALAASAEVSRRLSTATNPRQLAVEVVEQVQSAFHYYHAHIYFVDEETGDLVMAGGTGEAGVTMLARGHKVPKGRGLVGRAADTNAPVLVSDVTQAEGWLPNPLLPDTKSEVAIPISSGKQVLGVLDVQQNVVNGLSEEDVELLQSLASQVAISLHNARTFEESRAKAELESLVNTIGQKIQKTSSVEDTLQTAIREIGLALGASRVSANIAVRQDGGVDASQN